MVGWFWLLDFYSFWVMGADGYWRLPCPSPARFPVDQGGGARKVISSVPDAAYSSQYTGIYGTCTVKYEYNGKTCSSL